MDFIKNTKDIIQGDARFMRHLNGWLTIFWIIMIPISLASGWLKSVTFVSVLSLWALVSAHWSAWQAARVETEQQKEQRRDTAGQIARRIIKESNLKKSRSPKAIKQKVRKQTRTLSGANAAVQKSR